MVRTRQCDFCGDDIEAGTGTMFVRVDGTIDHYCSSKCERAADLGREPREAGWTEAGRAAGEAAAEATETDAPDLEAAEGETDLDEPEPEVDTDAAPDEHAAEPEPGDEDEEPVVDAGGGQEADAAEDADDAEEVTE
jgi:large subunit ribosomal protein L24e